MTFKALGLALCLSAMIAAPAFAQSDYPSLALWPRGAPGPVFGAVADTVTTSKTIGDIITHVQQPSITPFLPAAGTETGAAIVIAPGGGHKQLSIELEGYHLAQWLSQHGIAAFVLKYRLSHEVGSPYTIEGDELNDTQRAIRLVRAHAAEWHLDPARVGVMGFSAGGQLAALAGWRNAATVVAPDAVDQQEARPAFVALIYPNVPETTYTANLPPAFLLGGEKDKPAMTQALAELYLSLNRAGDSAELHILADTGHGFGFTVASPKAVAIWPTLFYNWLDAKGFLKSSHEVSR